MPFAPYKTPAVIVRYLAMDEPFLSGQLRRCGSELKRTADRLVAYYTGVRRAYTNVRIGLIEAYPSFSSDEFGTMLDLMSERGVPPAFVHLDVDLRAALARRAAISQDIRRIHMLCRARRIPFGVIIWGYDGNTDVMFARDAADLAAAFREVYTDQDLRPDHLIFQSWSESSSGLRIVPSNPPEDRQYTLTNITWNIYRRFIGPSVATGDRAIPRR